MIAHSLSHWGIFITPDSANLVNVQFNQDGSIEKFNDLDQTLVQCFPKLLLTSTPASHCTITKK